MPQKRKLQVFVSSTFTDLKEERQAAVEAILKAGHIPAGMELFAATDKSQMDVIKRWIDESDAYLLLLGGRYGSIEPDSGKSYTQLEYEYALEKGKAYFSIVIKEDCLNQKVNKLGKEVLELENPHKYKDFYSLATGSMVEFWGDLRDIKLAIHTTLSEFSDRPELVGWVPGSEATDSGTIAQEIARLAKENAELRAQLIQSPKDSTKYNGISFEDMYGALNREKIKIEETTEYYRECFTKIAEIFGDEIVSILHIFWVWNSYKVERYYESNDSLSKQVIDRIQHYGLVAQDLASSSYSDRFLLTNTGKEFLIRLSVERNILEAEIEIKKLKANTPQNAEYGYFLPIKKMRK
ncbi:hypothetical protein GCM10028819_33360 [Spirosoma humi]